MKHLKLFENQEYKEFWLVDYYIKDNNEHNFHLFEDEESAEIWVITVVNQEREEIDENYTDDMFFTEAYDALDWYEDHFSDIDLSYRKIKLSKPLKGISDKLQRLRDAKKYNL
jgi:hypothetical protein